MSAHCFVDLCLYRQLTWRLKEIHSGILLPLQCPSLEPLLGLISSARGGFRASDVYPHEPTQITFSVATYHSTHGISIGRCVQVFPGLPPHRPLPTPRPGHKGLP